MFLPDVNVCLAAFRHDHVDHQRCRQWVAHAYVHEPNVGMSPLVLAAVVRITTHIRYNNGFPSSLDEALNYCTALLTHPKTVTILTGASHWATFESCSRAANAIGKLVADAHHAALAMDHGCTWVSLDSDFAKFPGLKWRHP
jgi:hypothetical protein